MTAYPAWTPASRPGIIPLHPLSFGTILGRSFAALRQNPKVLLGFALIVQTAVYLVLIVGIGGIAFASFIRLDTLRPGSEDYETVLAGSVLITVLAGFVLGLAATALSVIVQAVVVAEVAHSVLAERLTLRALWQRVKPVAWRLIGYTFLLTLGLLVLFGVVGAAIFGLAVSVPAAAIVLTILVVLASIPLVLWLSTKLALVPSVLVLEHATIRGAVVRSWTLLRGRFWPALGVLVVIAVIMNVLAQVVSVPFSILSTGVTHDHRAHRRPDARRDRRHRHRHRAHPGRRAAHPVDRDRRAGDGRLADLHRLPDAPRRPRSRPAVVHRTTGCRGDVAPGPLLAECRARSRPRTVGARRRIRLRPMARDTRRRHTPPRDTRPRTMPRRATRPRATRPAGVPDARATARPRPTPPHRLRPGLPGAVPAGAPASEQSAPPADPAGPPPPLPPYAAPPATAWTAPGAPSGDDPA